MDISNLQKTRVLMYGRDSILLDTRRLILKTAGFDVQTLTNLDTFRDAVLSGTSPFKVAVLCHTVPEEEREPAAELAMRSQTRTFQIETLITPARLVSEVSRLAGRAAA